MAWPTVDQLKAKGYVNADGKVNTSKKYFIAYVGDYDAASWLYQRTHNIWDNPDRGKVPLMWCISPILAVRAPMAMEYIWETATENDYFAAADNGAGYLNPGMLEEPRPISGLPSGVEAWARHNKFHYDRWDLSITGFIIDGNGKGMTEKGVRSYATFSPNGIVPQKPPFTNYAGLYANMPITRPDASMSDGIQQVINIIGLHPDFPFYWGRAVLQTPSWYVEVKEGVEKLRPDFAWLTGPEFFELLRMYLKEGHYNTIVSQ